MLPPADPLTDLLDRELSDLRRFCALLEEERKVLTGAQADRLADIAKEKASLVAQLNQCEMQRDALLIKGGFMKGRPGMEAWLASQASPKTEHSRWNELLKLARLARDDNETNGRLINILLKQNQEALSVLLSGGAESIYGADGQQRSPATGKRSFGAA